MEEPSEDALLSRISSLLTPLVADLDYQYKCALTANLVFWTWSGVSLLLDRFILPAKTVAQIKIQGEQALLTDSERKDIFKVAAFNMGPLTLLFVQMDRLLCQMLNITHMAEHEEWVLSREVLLFFGCLAIQAVCFDLSHRLLHHPYFYRTIHKVHHRFKAPCAMAAVYAHPVEFIFGNIAGLAVGPIILHPHPYTSYAWFAVALFSICQTHSGYKGIGAEEHDAHHEFFIYNIGNLFDGLLGTKLPKDKEH